MIFINLGIIWNLEPLPFRDIVHILIYPIFRQEISSRINDIHLSICNQNLWFQIYLISDNSDLSSYIVSIDDHAQNHACQPLSLMAMVPIGHPYYQQRCLLAIMPISYCAYWPSLISAMVPIGNPYLPLYISIVSISRVSTGVLNFRASLYRDQFQFFGLC